MTQRNLKARVLVDFHRAANAHVTVAGLPVPIAHAARFGVIDAAGGGRVRALLEKPDDPPAIPGDPQHRDRGGSQGRLWCGDRSLPLKGVITVTDLIHAIRPSNVDGRMSGSARYERPSHGTEQP